MIRLSVLSSCMVLLVIAFLDNDNHVHGQNIITKGLYDYFQLDNDNHVHGENIITQGLYNHFPLDNVNHTHGENIITQGLYNHSQLNKISNLAITAGQGQTADQLITKSWEHLCTKVTSKLQ